MGHTQPLTDWLKDHPFLYPFILFLIGVAVSIYSQNVKRFLHDWPRTKEKKRQVQRNAVTRRLELLKLLHNNSYELIVYLGGRSVLMVYSLMFIGIVIGTAKALNLGVQNHKWAALAGVLAGILSGEFTGALRELHEIFRQLKSYEQSVTQLEQTLSKLEK
jgi:hypothetical protein